MKIGNTTIIFHDNEFNVNNLKKFYDFCNDNFKDETLYYTSKELEQLRSDKNNVFVKT